MTAPAPDDQAFAAAAARFLDGVADADDRERLRVELNASSARRRAYVQQARLHATLLGWCHQRRALIVDARTRRHRLRRVAVVAALAAAVLLALVLLRDTPPAQVQRGQALLADGRTLEPGAALPVDRPLIAGEPGPLVLHGHDGSQLRCTAGTRLALTAHRGRSWSLESGELHAVVAHADPDDPFIVVTPHARATVLGTTFRLRCQPGWSLLQVTQGRVACQTAHARLVLAPAASAHAHPDGSLTHFAAPSSLPWPTDIGNSAAWDHDTGTTITADGLRIDLAAAAADKPGADWVGVVGAHTTAYLPLPLQIECRVHSSHPLSRGMSAIISLSTRDSERPEAESFFYYVEASERRGAVVYDLVHSADMPRPLVKGDRSRPLTTPETWHIVLSRTHLRWSVDGSPLIDARLPRPLHDHVRVHALVNRRSTAPAAAQVHFSNLRIAPAP